MPLNNYIQFADNKEDEMNNWKLIKIELMILDIKINQSDIKNDLRTNEFDNLFFKIFNGLNSYLRRYKDKGIQVGPPMNFQES